MSAHSFVRRVVILLTVLAAALSLSAGASLLAQSGKSLAGKSKMRSTTAAQRRAAAANKKAVRDTAVQQGLAAPSTVSATALAAAVPALGPDYFGFVPNYANSPLPIVAGTSVSGGIRKFVDTLPGLNTPNNLGQMIPIAVPDPCAPSGQAADCYEIELREYSLKMHSDLPPTRLRGYVQVKNGADVAPINYLGPVIVATRDKPVRVKFTNKLPSTALGGNLFLPTDTTYMGAGEGPIPGANYTENRATLHLHGGTTPWISDGTPHQWTTPAAEGATAYPQGVSVRNVPDMDGGTEPQGTLTFFYSNQQSARLMFYHDHAYGITRLNVYAGEAAGYVLTDTVEQNLIASGLLPNLGIPLVIQDKTFVPDTTAPFTNANGAFASQLAAQDPTWDVARWGGTGSLWFPHVYMPNQNPYDVTGANAMGRWDYGPWFWPPFTGIQNGPVANPYYDPLAAPWEPPVMPGTPALSGVPESFLDTSIVNGTAFPVLSVDPKAYRFRILNAANDRFYNLSLWVADPAVTTADGRTNTEVKMVPFNSSQNLLTPFPLWWYTQGLPFSLDDRVGGVPDPTTRGPALVQIGTEGGFLPAPVVIRNQPVNYVYNRRDIVVGNVLQKALFLGPAERADVLVDFSKFAGKTLILYSDAPAPVPAADPRNDYFTGDMDQTDTGGAPTTLAGYGPNTRTIMQIRVSGGGGTAPVDDFDATSLAQLRTALPAAFAASQDPIIVPQAPYTAVYTPATPFPPTSTLDTAAYVKIHDSTHTFTPIGQTAPLTLDLMPKSIIEDFTMDYGRMNATLGLEIPRTNAINQTSIPQNYVDPPTEVIKVSDPTSIAPIGTAADGTQLWKITHNGVDTHAMHVHMFTVQLINRVGWDGAIRAPDPNELGWKDTVRMNPLEDVIVALRPVKLTNVPFRLPNSIRPLDVTRPLGSLTGFFNVDPNGNPVTVVNELTNFGWEYVWHCHLLGHEENDMMRPMAVAVPPEAPVNLTAQFVGTTGNLRVVLSWADSSLSATSFTVQRSSDNFATFTSIPLGKVTTYTDVTASTYAYRVFASNTIGSSLPTYPRATVDSGFSNIAVPVGGVPAAPTNLVAANVPGATTPRVSLTFTDNAANETAFTLQRSTNSTFSANVVTVTLATNVTSYLDTTVAWQQTYFYRVRATNAFGVSAFSNIASITVQANPSGLVLSFNFNETSGTRTTDSSGNQNNGTMAIATRVAGQPGFGGAISFDGFSSVVNVPNSASLALTTGMTLEAWVRPTALAGLNGATGWRTIIMKERTTTGLSYAMYGNDGNPNPARPAGYVRIGTVDQTIAAAPALPLNTWTHVAVSYDGATLKLYVNGVLRSSRAQTGAIVSSTNPLRIGGNIVFPSEYFAGQIDEVRIYNRALTLSQIATDMVTPVP